MLRKLARRHQQDLIERRRRTRCVTIHHRPPGVVIGKRGEDIEAACAKAQDDGRPGASTSPRCASPSSTRSWSPIDRAAARARRIMFRRAMKRAVGKRDAPGRAGHQGHVAGRPSTAPKSRARSGTAKAACRCTLRADVDYGLSEAHTTYGVIGIKVGSTRAKSSISARSVRRQDDGPRSDRGDQWRPCRPVRAVRA